MLFLIHARIVESRRRTTIIVYTSNSVSFVGQKSRHMKDLTMEDDHLSPVTTCCNDLSMIQHGVSIVTPTRSNVLEVVASMKTTDDEMSFLPISTFPRSTWVRSSVPVALRDVFVARALFHYTLCNPHRSL